MAILLTHRSNKIIKDKRPNCKYFQFKDRIKILKTLWKGHACQHVQSYKSIYTVHTDKYT